MRILTLDLSTRSTGYTIGQQSGLERYGCIVSNSANVIARIIKMREQIKLLVQNEHIDKVIMEEVRAQCNSHVNKVLTWLQAAVVIMLYEVNPKIQYELIGVTTWRSVLKMRQGPGVKRDAAKMQDIQYVYNKYHKKVNDDEADAICLFDAYWQNFNNEINWE